ncbi:unnamed protein product [Brassica rapa]|uniref:Uncharacterized protein n=1 Tax=Brassica campestris TaxID=3711 RepID=A0A3P6DGC9_BRACM|nr:unnamed protein product [Brassica rapa]VDD23164.1 unnamed protein product [Brassica rapa]
MLRWGRGFRMLGELYNLERAIDSTILEEVSMRRPLMKNILVNIDIKVSALINPENNSWNMDLLKENFYPEDIQSIVKLKPVGNQDDY